MTTATIELDDFQEMLNIIPERPYSTPGSGYFRIPEPNAYVCKTKDGVLEIYPSQGGVLAANFEDIYADIAPFHG